MFKIAVFFYKGNYLLLLYRNIGYYNIKKKIFLLIIIKL